MAARLLRTLKLQIVMCGHSRSKNSVASLAYDPRIHPAMKRTRLSPACISPHITMDHRVKPDGDEER